jgi:glycosyltransferase involved in cell wall biosynthesis
MKIAWFTPFRRKGSGIALFSAAACPSLPEGCEVVVFASDLGKTFDPDDACSGDFPVVGLLGADPEEVLQSLAGFSLAVYNMGDHAGYHKSIYEYSMKHPGIVVLHDLVMRDFFAEYFLEADRARLPELLGLMEYCHGAPAADWMRDLIDGKVFDLWSDPRVLEYHMARGAVRHSLGVVTHSEFTRGQVSEFAGAAVATIAFPAPPLAETALGWDPPAASEKRPVNFLTVGHVNRNKVIDLVIECIASSPLLRESVVYTVAGSLFDTDYRDHLVRLVEDHGVGHAVRIVGQLPDDVLHEVIREADVMVVLRKPHMGESSWSLLEALFAAKPTVVWDHGSYAEIPDWATRKVSSREGLTATLEQLCQEPGLRRLLGEQARRHAVETFGAKSYGRALVAFAESILHDRVVLDLTDRVARKIVELGTDPATRPILDRVADEIGLFSDNDHPCPDPYSRRVGSAVSRAPLSA